MKRLLLSFCAIVLFTNSLSASGEIYISTTRPTVNLISGGSIHIPLVIKIQNNKDNRKIRLDWELGASERQINNPTAKEFDGSKPYEITKEDEYLFYTDHDFCQSIVLAASGLILPQGQYEIKATLTRIVDGKEKKFTSMVKVTIGTIEEKGK